MRPRNTDAPHHDESQAEQVAHLVPSGDVRAVSGRQVRLTKVMTSGYRCNRRPVVPIAPAAERRSGLRMVRGAGTLARRRQDLRLRSRCGDRPAGQRLAVSVHVAARRRRGGCRGALDRPRHPAARGAERRAGVSRQGGRPRHPEGPRSPPAQSRSSPGSHACFPRKVMRMSQSRPVAARTSGDTIPR
jgi:hypothetical protein